MGDLDALLENRRAFIDILGLQGRELQLYEGAIVADFERGGVDWLGLGALRQQLAINRWDRLHGESHLAALKSLQTPSLVMHGVHDPLIPIQGGQELASLIP